MVTKLRGECGSGVTELQGREEGSDRAPGKEGGVTECDGGGGVKEWGVTECGVKECGTECMSLTPT